MKPLANFLITQLGTSTCNVYCYWTVTTSTHL